MATTEKNGSAQANQCLLEIPLGEAVKTTFGLHVDTTLSPDSSHKLRRLADALDRQRAEYAGPRGRERVVNATQALKWLLEQIS